MSVLPAQFAGLDVPRETFAKLERYSRILANEALKHNLIASSTIADLWSRHLEDSAQLIRWGREGSWVDIGSGAGLPGLVIAILTGAPVTLVEPRRLRSEFLAAVALDLGLTNVTVAPAKAAAVVTKFQNITARAVAPASALIAMTHHLAGPNSQWVLPKGRNAQKELADLRVAWQGSFRLEPSRTDPQASILLATKVRPRGKR